MLAGCSMSTRRLDLPCTFPKKDLSRPPPVRQNSLSLEKPTEPKPTCSLKQTIRLPPSPTTAQATVSAFGGGEIKTEFWSDKGKSLKRLAEERFVDDELRIKRKKGRFGFWESDEFSSKEKSTGSFWVHQPGFGVSHVPQVPFSVTCSGEEERERVCFVPTDVISSPLPLSHNPWVDSVVTEITEFGDKDGETSHGPVKDATTSGSSSSLESHSLGLRLNQSGSEPECGNGSMTHNPGNGASGSILAHDNGHQLEHEGFELVSLLMGCIEAISTRNIPAINHYIAKLGDLASPRGRSSISRVTAYFTEALALRVTRVWPRLFHITLPRELDRLEDETGSSLRLLNQVSPIPKFIHFTANEILLRAFEGKDRVHIIDFDIKQGLQWPSLFQSLASRSHPPSHVRITGIGESKQELVETGERIAGFAEAFNLDFEFHPVVDRLEDVRLWMLHVKEGETVAINCFFQMHKTLYDTNGGAFRDFIGLIRSTKPVAVVIAEQEADHNELNLEKRVCNSLRYYSAVFDAIDTSLPLDSAARIKIEEFFATEIRNIIACEGRDRFERHVSFEKWRSMMEEVGFRCLGIENREIIQSQMLLRMYSSESSYNVETQGRDALTLTWMDQPLYSVSGWAPVDAAN